MRPRDVSTFGGDAASLDVAQVIARALDAPFDRQATLALARRLYETYYEHLGRLLGPPFTTTPFDASALRRVNAWVQGESGGDTIYFDEQLDFWLFACAHLTTVAACKALSGAEYRSLTEAFADQLNIPGNPWLHEPTRGRFKGFLLRHPDCLELSHALSRAMVIFVMCHEAAHSVLGHTLEAARRQHEIDADRLAATLFARVIDAGSSAGLIFIHPKLASAPVLMMRFFDLIERHAFRQTGTRSRDAYHPPAMQRAGLLEERLSARLSSGARYLLDGFVAALEDVAIIKKLSPIP